MTLRHTHHAMRIAALCALLVPAAGCGAGMMTEEPYLKSGDRDSAEVAFETNRALADNVAMRHCAEFNRVARFIGRGPDSAYYECDQR